MQNDVLEMEDDDMKIDLHCHTKKVKKGDVQTREVTKDLFAEKIKEADVKVVAITNHNYFDEKQYYEFQTEVKDYCSVWPGIELDIWCGNQDNKKRGHLIVVSNPQELDKFIQSVQELLGDIKPDDFITDLKNMYKILGSCKCIYIPHYHKKPGFSDEDIEELSDLLNDTTLLFKETADYRSLGVFSNFDYSMIIGSDVQDWSSYEKCTFADLRLPVNTFEQFCLLAQKDTQIINTLLNEKKGREIIVSPYKDCSFKLPFYNDVNVIFGQKGTGKTEIIESLKKYFVEAGISFSEYVGSEKETDFSKMLKTDKTSISAEKLGLKDFSHEFQEIYDWKEELPTSIYRYISWYTTKDNNKNKSRMKITECVHLEKVNSDRKIEMDYNSIKDFMDSSFSQIDFSKYITDEEQKTLYKILYKIFKSISDFKFKKWIEEKSVLLTNFSIDTIKICADKCSDTVSKPSTTGFYDFAMNRLRLQGITDEIQQAFLSPDYMEKEYLGILEDKGDLFVQTRYRFLQKTSRTDEFVNRISDIKNAKQTIEKIISSIYSDGLSESIDEFRKHFDNGIKDITSFIGVMKEIIMENGNSYNPSNGERGILLMQRSLSEDCDVYLLDEPELGMGNSYITSSILPKLISLAKRRKMIIVATHNANIAVRTLPFSSILRTHENGLYKTYVGNLFCDKLINIDDNTDVKNWTYESMHTLEGGREAFYGRKGIYESGRDDY